MADRYFRELISRKGVRGLASTDLPTPNLRIPTTVHTGKTAAVFFAAFSACLLTDWPNRTSVEFLSALCFPVLGLIFVTLSVLLTRSTQGRSRTAWMAMTIGLTGWALAEWGWAYFALVVGRTPIPSWPDAVYAFFVPGVAAALLLFPSARSWRDQSRVVLDGLILTGSFVLISWLAVLRGIWQARRTTGLEFLISLGYPAGDFLLLTLGFLVFLRVATGLRATLGLLIGAFVCVTLADSVWVYLKSSAGYTLGSLPDYLNVGAALLVIVALVAAYHAESNTGAVAPSPSRLALWLPLLPLAVAGLFVASGHRDAVMEPPVIIGVTALIVATLIRQVLEAAEAVRREERIRTLADRLTSDLDSAARYVASILPGELTGPVTVSSRYLPSRTLGGDSFGYTWIDDDHLIVYLIDVSGHGLEPALLSVSVHNLLRSNSLPAPVLLAPDRVLAELNERFSMDDHGGHYFTMWYGTYRLSTGQLRYAGAGHPPALALTQEGGTVIATPLEGRSMPVGMFDKTVFTVESYQVPAGTRILVYSDGVLGDPPQLDEFVALCTDSAATMQSLDALVDSLPFVGEGPVEEDDRSLVQLTFSG